jgi:uncharacterized protein YjbJ (UPF0337 family)
MKMAKVTTKQVKGSVKKAVDKVTGAGKREAKSEKPNGKGQIALGSKRDALYDDFST